MAKEFNSDLELKGKAIIYTVPNGTGTVLTYNANTKEVSTRTNSELISDMSLMTTNTNQNVTAIKGFGGAADNTYTGASIRIDGGGSSDSIFPTLSFHQPGLYAGTFSFRGDGFHFMNILGDNYETVKSNGFIKDGSDNNHVLLGAGDHKALSDFVSQSDLNVYQTLNTDQTVSASKSYYSLTPFKLKNSGTKSWVFHKPLANYLIFAPSMSNGAEDWDWANQICFYDNGTISSNGFIKNGYDGNHVLLDDGSSKLISDFVGSKIINGYYDANNLSANSITYGYNVANAPSSASTHSFTTLNMSAFNPNFSFQLGFDGDTNETFSRIKSNGTWYDWERIAKNSDITAAIGNYVTLNTEQIIDARKVINKNLGTNDYVNVAQHSSQFQIGRISDSKSLEFAVLDNGISVIQSKEAGVGYNGLVLNQANNGGVAIGGLPDTGYGFTVHGATFSRDGLYTNSHGNSGQWKYAYDKRLDGVTLLSGYGGDRLIVGYGDGTSYSSPYSYGIGVVDTRIQNNGLDSDGTGTYFPNAFNINLNNKLTPIFHLVLGDWKSSIVMKGWSGDYRAWRVTGDAALSDAETDFYLSQSKSSDGTWLPYRKIWTERNFNPDNKVNKSGDTMTGPLSISTSSDAFFINTSGSVLSAKLSNSTSDAIIRMTSTSNPFWDIRAQNDGSFRIDNNSINRFNIETNGNINLLGNALKYNGYIIWHEGNFNPSNYLQNGSAIQVEEAGGIANGSDTRPNKTWFDYNWAGTGYAGSVINFSGLANGKYNVELFASYAGGGTALGFRSRNGDAGSWNLHNWIWHSGNFNPNNYIATSHVVNGITLTNIQQWNHAFDFGIKRNEQFTTMAGVNLLISDGYFGDEAGLIDNQAEVIIAGKLYDYYKYGSTMFNDWSGLNYHSISKTFGIGKGITNTDDKVQLKGDLSVEAKAYTNERVDLILNPLYNTNGDIRTARNAHIYVYASNIIRLPETPILGQRFELHNSGGTSIEVMQDSLGVIFEIPSGGKITGIATDKGFAFDENPIKYKVYDV